MTRRWAAYAAAGLLACAAGTVGVRGTAWAAGVIQVDGGSGADISTCGSASAPCLTIGYAFAVRAVDGDTIRVAAGVYAAADASGATSYLAIAGKSVHFEGARAGVDARDRVPGGSDESVIVNADVSASPAYLWYVLADGVSIDGFTFEGNAAGAGVATDPAASGYRLENNVFTANAQGLHAASDGTTASVVRHNLFLTNNGGTGPLPGFGLYTDQTLHNVTVAENAFRGQTGDPLAIDTPATPSSALTIRSNSLDGEGFVGLRGVTDSSVTDNSMVGGPGGIAIAGADRNLLVARNTILDKAINGITVVDFGAGANTGITIADNAIGRAAGNGVEISAPAAVEVRHNLITDSGTDGIAVTVAAGIHPDAVGLSPGAAGAATGSPAAGAGGGPAAGPAGGIIIIQNTVDGSRGAHSGIHLAAGGFAGPITVNFNRIVHSASGNGLVDDAADAIVDARWNWWGCNTPPDGAGCDRPVSGASAQITYRPWLILTIDSDPTGIEAGRAATVRATLRRDSAGGLAAGPFFAPVPITFTASPGAVTAARVTTDAQLLAVTGWPAGQPRPPRICAAVDNETGCLALPAGPPVGGGAGAGNGALPSTGSPSGRLVLAALLLIGIGAAMVAASRPRRPWWL
jgi:hypothetical protein